MDASVETFLFVKAPMLESPLKDAVKCYENFKRTRFPVHELQSEFSKRDNIELSNGMRETEGDTSDQN